MAEHDDVARGRGAHAAEVIDLVRPPLPEVEAHAWPATPEDTVPAREVAWEAHAAQLPRAAATCSSHAQVGSCARRLRPSRRACRAERAAEGARRSEALEGVGAAHVTTISSDMVSVSRSPRQTRVPPRSGPSVSICVAPFRASAGRHQRMWRALGARGNRCWAVSGLPRPSLARARRGGAHGLVNHDQSQSISPARARRGGRPSYRSSRGRGCVHARQRGCGERMRARV